MAMTRRDMASPASIKEWQSYYTHEARRATLERRPKSPVLFLDARQGLDVHKLKMLIFKAGAAVNQRCGTGGAGSRGGGDGRHIHLCHSRPLNMF